jgi:hypothetical protein
MPETVIAALYKEFKETKKITIPDHLKPCKTGYNLISWLTELLRYYGQESTVVRPFDDLPPIRLSQLPEIETTIQDVHRFLISDLNLMSVDLRMQILQQSVSHDCAAAAWQAVSEIVRDFMQQMDDDTAAEELSWKFGSVSEMLLSLTWVFMQREGVAPPPGIMMASHRFPYYLWLTGDGRQSFWEPDNCLCRREWLALDVFRSRQL